MNRAESAGDHAAFQLPAATSTVAVRDVRLTSTRSTGEETKASASCSYFAYCGRRSIPCFSGFALRCAVAMTQTPFTSFNGTAWFILLLVSSR
jgi:hypothetical protein